MVAQNPSHLFGIISGACTALVDKMPSVSLTQNTQS